jgi:PAS domain S-box-containing protein
MDNPIHILIVDDDSNLRRTLGDILRARGFEPCPCATGREALEQVVREKIAIALIDLRLGDISGLEVLREIKRSSPSTECILVTGHASQATAIEAVNLGAYSFYQKPYDLDQLLLSIQHAVQKGQAEAAVRASEERYRMLAENMSDTVWLMDMNLRNTYISPSVTRQRGYTLDELNAIPLAQQMTPDSLKRSRQLFDEVLRPENLARSDLPTAYSIDLEFFKKDGSRFWSANTFVLIRNTEGQPVNILGSGRDITERKRAEDALREAETKLRALVEQVPAIVYTESASDHSNLYISPQIEALTGYARAEWLGCQDFWKQVVHPDDLALVIAEDERTHLSGEKFQIEYRFINQDGSISWVRDEAVLIRDETGQPLFWQGVMHDITDKKRAEEAFRESQRQLSTLMSNLPGMAYRCQNDPDWTMEFISEGSYQLTGHQPQEMLANATLTYGNLIHPDDRQMVWDLIEAEVAKKQPFQLSYRILTADGEEKWVWEQGRGVYDPDGSLVALEGFIIDITARKLAEERLLASEENYRTLFENIPDGVYRTTPEGKFLSANPAFVRMFGFESEAELEPLTAYDFYVNPQDRETFLQEAETNRAVTNMEVLMRRKDGQEIYSLDNARSRYKADGTVLYIEGTLTDITARKRAEDDLRRRTLEAETLWEASSALTSSLELDQVLDNLLSQLAQAIPFDSATVFLHEDQSLLAVAAQGLPRPEEVIGQRFPANSSLIEDVDQTLQPLIVADVQKDSRFGKWGGTDYVRGWMSIPLIVHGKVIGNLTVDSRTPNAYNETHSKLALAFANQAAVAIENARLFEETRRRVAELEVLYESSLSISRLLNPRQIAQTMTEILSQKLSWHHAAVRLYHPENHSTELLEFHQPDVDSKALDNEIKRLQQVIQTGQGLTGWVIEHGEAIRCDDVQADPRYFQTFPGIRSGLYVPMKLGDTILGCISAESTQPAAFDEQDQRLLSTMAAQAAIAIHQAQLYEQVQQYATELEKRVEERTADLQRANLELARASRMKDEFLASMSHELRTPLTGILGLSESLQLKTYGDLTEKQLMVLKNIENSGRHLLELINDILDLSKIEAGKFEMQVEPFSLVGVCQASLQMTKGMAQHKRQHSSFSITPDSIVVRADARRLKQMLVNLLSNAVKFTPEDGSLGIEVKGSEHEKRVRITVWDTGIGIQPEDLPRLFKPFVQLDSSLSRQYAGTGLGLSLVQRMAALHGGSVEVESVPGEGSRFTIILPWETESLQPSVPTDKTTNPLKQALTIDENEVNAELLTHYLEKLGLSNQVHSAGLDAVEQAAQARPDIILLHLNLPDKPGLELLAEFKSDDRTRDIPVIIMSVEEKQDEALALGAVGYLVKPFLLADLQVELRRVAALASLPAPTVKVSPVVLLADDNEIILEVLADFLRTRDFQLIPVHSGSELLEQVEEIRPDILLIDIQMPGMNGLEVMRRIRAHSDARISALPMIAVTALAMSGDRERCLAAGANEYLSKPLHLENLVETIQGLCKG